MTKKSADPNKHVGRSTSNPLTCLNSGGLVLRKYTEAHIMLTMKPPYPSFLNANSDTL